MQEQHNDLLGLLAQQELELYVFKLSLEDNVGALEVRKAEQKAQKEAIAKYGSYIDFRSNAAGLDDGEDYES